MKSTALANWLLLAVTTLLGFLLLEGVSRYIQYRHMPSNVVFDRDFTYSYRPNSARGPHPNFGGRVITLNDAGCIGADIDRPKQANERRIILLGGSTSASSLYVDAVQAEVAAANQGLTASVMSCGRPAYTSYNNLVFLKKNLLRLEPDVVVIYLGINNAIYNAQPFIGDLPNIGYFDYRSWNTSIFFELVRYHLFKKKLRVQPRFDSGTLRSERFLASHLEKIIELGRRRGFRVVLSTFALSYPTEDAVLARKIAGAEAGMRHFWGTIDSTVYAVRQHNAVIRELARRHGLPLAEVDGAIPHTSEFFNDICHMTPPAQRILGERIGRAIGDMSPRE